MEFITIGYVLIEGVTKVGSLHPSVTYPVFTPTPCVCNLHPSTDAFSWAVARGSYIADLGIEGLELQEFQASVDKLYDDGFWGLGATFTNLSEAVKFKNKWFSRDNNVKVFELSILENLLPEFLDEMSPPTSHPKLAPAAVYLAAQAARISKTDTESVLGYEIVGFSPWGDPHTSVCYEIRDGFVEDLHADFNAHGYFASVEVATLAAKQSNEAVGGSVGDAYWVPVRISCLETGVI